MSRNKWGSVACSIGIMISAVGCGSQTSQPATQAASPGTTSPASAESGTAAATPTVNTPTTTTQSTAPAVATVAATTNPTATPTAPRQPDQSASENGAKLSSAPQVAAAQPTTAKAAIELINLKQLAKIKLEQEYESGPTLASYSSSATLAEADQFYEKLLTENGWQSAEHVVMSNDQYIDRLKTKDGYYVRLILSGGGANQTTINLSSLGNFDMRTLPKTSDAEPQESNAVMAGYRTSQSISDASESLAKQMLELGWQLVDDTAPPMPEVPHYRSMRFRKQAIRLNLGLVKDPVKPEEKVIVFYHAEHVIPMDIPTIDHRRPLRMDAMANNVRIPWEGNRETMVELLEKHGESLGWQLVNKADFVAQKVVTLFIKTVPTESYGDPNTVVGLAGHYMESQGKYWIELQRSTLPKPRPTSVPAEVKLADADEPTDDSLSAETKTKQPASSIDTEIAQAQAAADQLINQELAKALGSLGGKPADMKALQAQAAELQAKLVQPEIEDTSESLASDANEQLNISFDVPDDQEPVSADDKKIKQSVCKLKFGPKEYVLNQCMALTKVEDGATVKIIMFSDKPLAKAATEKKFFAKESVSVFEAAGDTNPSATVEFQVMDESIAMNLYAEGFSMGANSSHIKSTVRHHAGKLQGRVYLDEPMEVQDKQLTITAVISETLTKPK